MYWNRTFSNRNNGRISVIKLQSIWLDLCGDLKIGNDLLTKDRAACIGMCGDVGNQQGVLILVQVVYDVCLTSL